MGPSEFSIFVKILAGMFFVLGIANATQYKKRPKREYYFPVACFAMALALVCYGFEWSPIISILCGILTVAMLAMDHYIRTRPPEKVRTPQSPTKKGFDL